MTAAEFKAWVEHMRRLNPKITDQRLAEMIGCSRNQIRFWQVRDPGLMVGLACNAALNGLPPWKPHQRATDAATLRNG